MGDKEQTIRQSDNRTIGQGNDPASSDGPSVRQSDCPTVRSSRWLIYGAILAVAAGVMAAGMSNAVPLMSANDRSRWCTVWSLVERGTYRIDEIIQEPGWDTIDKVRHEGHFYSSKPVLLPTLVAGIYWTVRETTGWTLLEETALVTRWILVVVNLIPLTMALVLIAVMAERFARTQGAKVYVVLTAGLGTFLTTFSVTLNNHTVAAAAVVFAVYPAVRILVDRARCPFLFALSGFFAAFASANELPAALFGLALFGLLFRHAPKETLLYFLPAAVVPVAAFIGTTWWASGDWKPFYFYYGTEKYLYVHEGVPSYWMNPGGLDRNLDPPWIYLLHCTVGHHGLFSLSPVFLLSVVGWAGIRRWRDHEQLKPVLWAGLFLTVAVLGFYLMRTENYNYGGKTAGLRWMFWLIPMWLLAMIPVLDEWGHRLWFRVTAAVLLGLSVFSAMYPLNNPWQHPWLFVLMERAGWIDYSDEPPPEFERPLTTWFPKLPEPADGESPQWVELSGPGFDGEMTRLRLSDAGRTKIDGRTIQRIAVTWVERHSERSEESPETLRSAQGDNNAAAHRERSAVYHVDVALFRAGEPPAKFLLWPKGPPSPEGEAEALTFLRALPSLRPYQNGYIRYLKTPLREDAFRCQRAASRVRFQPSPPTPLPQGEGSGVRGRSYWYRTDVWLCPDVPFGVVRVVSTISDAETDETVARRSLTVTAASEFPPQAQWPPDEQPFVE